MLECLQVPSQSSYSHQLSGSETGSIIQVSCMAELKSITQQKILDKQLSQE